MPKTVLMIGAGAVDGGWEAVFTALKKLYPHLHPDGCNLAFANMVHRLRWLAHATLENSDQKAALDRAKCEYGRLKEHIAEELNDAFQNGRLSLREYGKDLSNRSPGRVG